MDEQEQATVVPIRPGQKGHKITPEQRAKMVAGRRAGLERQKREKEEARIRDEAEAENRKREQEAERNRTATKMIDLKDQAIKRVEEILYGDEASAAQVIATAKMVLEHVDGKPTQKVEMEQIQRIEYVMGDWEQDAPALPGVAVGE